MPPAEAPLVRRLVIRRLHWKGDHRPFRGILGWGVGKAGISVGWEGGKLRKLQRMEGVGHAPGGLGGACVSESVCAEVPPFQLRVDHELPCFLKRSWGALRRNQRHGHTRPPNPGVMKRPEYREAGKVGSCENCSAWKDARHAPGGLGGACVQKPACAWLPPICVWENARWHG